MRISDWSSDVCSSDLVARAREGRTDDGNVVFELVRRQSVAELGIDLLAPKRRVGLDHWTPLRVERLVRLPASDDEAVNRSVTLSLKPLLRSGFRARPDRSPEIGRLRKIGQRLLIKHHIAEQAVLEMVFEVGRELRIANDEVARRIEQSRAI